MVDLPPPTHMSKPKLKVLPRSAASPEVTGDAWPDSPGVSYGPQTFHSTPGPAAPLTNGLKSATSKEIGLNVSTQKCESEHGTPPRGKCSSGLIHYFWLTGMLERGAYIACNIQFY